MKNVFKHIAEVLSTKTISEEDLESILLDWKLQLVGCDVAYQVAEYIESEVMKTLKGLRISRSENLGERVRETIKTAVLKIIRDAGELDLEFEINERMYEGKIPIKMVFVGINGSGKTTTIAKLAYMFKEKGLLSVLACSDTFRAGAEEQLMVHANRLGLKMIKHKYGADPAAVAYDAVNYAHARKIPLVLIDTAGRMHTDKDLMAELKKIIKVINADYVIFVGDALAGNDALTQAEKFNEYLSINGSIITKIDADVKGGAALSIMYAIKKPILYLGVGQRYCDLIKFNCNWLIQKLFMD
ncbi:MAG: signal recognition particle-docking protein FtsY [Candidatus Methanomethylicia archaeon]|nr:signal recognition particle-docking protein FtsY [Candidatus Methanomethylicia archaeon]MCX8169294.1 signal recognition particle-docking protein FtsY [Candidatus Methanomethylicia archaeon]MDW7988923.1 signal recognition particle-docking protein FtsY [Nitrososphaerota archaeon]